MTDQPGSESQPEIFVFASGARFMPANELELFVNSPETAVDIAGSEFYGDRAEQMSKRTTRVIGNMVLYGAQAHADVIVDMPHAFRRLANRIIGRDAKGVLSYTVSGTKHRAD